MYPQSMWYFRRVRTLWTFKGSSWFGCLRPLDPWKDWKDWTIWGASEQCNWWTGMAYLGQRRTTKLWPAEHIAHRGFDEAHQRCYEEKCCKPMANGEKRSNLSTKLPLMVVNLFGSFREGCGRIFQRGSGLYFWASLSCRSWIFLAIYASESSSDMNPWRTWPVVSCVMCALYLQVCK